MDRLERLLNIVEDEVSNGHGYEELASYEQDAAYEMENYLVGNFGYSRPKGKEMSKRIVKRPEIMGLIKQHKNSVNMGGNHNGQLHIAGNKHTPAAAAQFDFTIKRLTHAINASLPVALFAPQELENGYRQMLADQIPAGTVLTAVNYSELDGKPTEVDFVYTEGANVDTIRVQVVQYPYPSFLKSMVTDVLKLSKMRYSLSDSTKLAQFSEVFNFRQGSMFGTVTTNKVSVTANKDPRQFQDGIIDVDGEFVVDKERGIVIGMADTGSNDFTVTLSMFVQKFDRHTGQGF